MARSQQQGIGSITTWMIIFVALWLTSTVFLVVLYTGQSELMAENERFRTENDRLISSNEKNSLDFVRDARPAQEGGPTVVGLIEGARKETALLATGNGEDDPETVRTKRDDLVATIISDDIVPKPRTYEGASLWDCLGGLYDSYKSERALRLTAEDRVAELEAEVANLVQLNADQKADFDERARQLGERLAQVEADREAYRKERDAAVEQLERQFEARIAQADADLTAERQKRLAIERDLQELRERFMAYQAKFGGLMLGPDEMATARQPDGKILTAVPGDPVVYIDLGRDDRMILGMRFSVYSAETGIPPGGEGKARIEVVSMTDSSAECRIVQVAKNEVILEGDLIANPIYDPNRSLTFVAIGEFDLNHDGQPDPDGVATIESLINDWGGEVSSELSAMTDFVILGSPPPRPRKRVGTTISAARAESIQKAWDTYHETLTTARSLSVPVMTQDLFLNFLGYGYQTAQR